MCPRPGSASGPTVAQIVVSIPPYQFPSAPPGGPGVPLDARTPAEQRAWIADRRARLHQKQARERAYLDRRALRGTHTPTDEAYEQDQLLENDLQEALDLLEAFIQQGGAPAASGSYAALLFPAPDYNDPLKP